MTASHPSLVVVGLVGRIAAGKSTVARALAARGAEVIDADRIAHDVLDEPDTRSAVVRRFGAGVLRADGRVDRAALARIVFGSTPEAGTALAALENLVHPRVRERIAAALDGLRDEAATAGDARRVVVLDVPLLVQAGWDERCDRIVLVECDEQVRRARMAARGWTTEHQEKRDAAWARGYRPPPPRKTTPVDASGDAAYIHGQIDGLWRSMS